MFRRLSENPERYDCVTRDAPIEIIEEIVPRNLPDTDIKVLYCFYQNNDDSKCEVAHRSPSLIPHKNPPDLGARRGTHGTETVRIYRRDGVDHPSGHDVDGGCADERVTDLPASTFAFVLRGTMREHVLLFCLLGLVLTATILLVTAPRAVTWALSLIE
jgi:hypothetical protein